MNLRCLKFLSLLSSLMNLFSFVLLQPFQLFIPRLAYFNPHSVCYISQKVKNHSHVFKHLQQNFLYESQPVLRQKGSERATFSFVSPLDLCVSETVLVGGGWMESSCCAEFFSSRRTNQYCLPHTTQQHSPSYIFSDPYFLLFYTRSCCLRKM